MVRLPNIDCSSEQIAELCRRWNIQRLAFFGSVLREDFHNDSDVDILVEFTPGKSPGLAFITIQNELSTLIGREVDLVTFKGLNRRIRNRILESAVVQYADG